MIRNVLGLVTFHNGLPHSLWSTSYTSKICWNSTIVVFLHRLTSKFVTFIAEDSRQGIYLIRCSVGHSLCPLLFLIYTNGIATKSPPVCVILTNNRVIYRTISKNSSAAVLVQAIFNITRCFSQRKKENS